MCFFHFSLHCIRYFVGLHSSVASSVSLFFLLWMFCMRNRNAENGFYFLHSYEIDGIWFVYWFCSQKTEEKKTRKTCVYLLVLVLSSASSIGCWLCIFWWTAFEGKKIKIRKYCFFADFSIFYFIWNSKYRIVMIVYNWIVESV